ncbi:hypothetical protein B0H19DRAFT_1074437 [Mycena capillaripes]|nr:hypothetical protein B0H19DRAFT_1074437 [Mycena capillaripes]
MGYAPICELVGVKESACWIGCAGTNPFLPNQARKMNYLVRDFVGVIPTEISENSPSQSPYGAASWASNASGQTGASKKRVVGRTLDELYSRCQKELIIFLHHNSRMLSLAVNAFDVLCDSRNTPTARFFEAPVWPDAFDAQLAAPYGDWLGLFSEISVGITPTKSLGTRSRVAGPRHRTRLFKTPVQDAISIIWFLPYELSSTLEAKADLLSDKHLFGMGGLTVVETIVEYAPAALNLLANLAKWLNEVDLSGPPLTANTANGTWPRVTMRRGKPVSIKDNPNPDMQKLTDNLTTKVHTKFQAQYSYAFAGNGSYPGAGVSKLSSSDDFVTCPADNMDALTNYVNVIVKNNLPEWAQKPLQNAVTMAMSDLLSGSATNAWISQSLPQSITGGAENTTLQADIELLYCVTQAPITGTDTPGATVMTLFCRYLGVYYIGEGWPTLTAPNVGVPGTTAQILDIDCTVSDATLAIALGVQIVRMQPLSVNTIFTVSSGKLSVGVAIKCATEANADGTNAQSIGAPPILLDWFVDILKDNKVAYKTQLRNATAAEYQELQYLDNWDAVAAFKKGDFRSLKF